MEILTYKEAIDILSSNATHQEISMLQYVKSLQFKPSWLIIPEQMSDMDEYKEWCENMLKGRWATSGIGLFIETDNDLMYFKTVWG